jgi:hypothetical protein
MSTIRPGRVLAPAAMAVLAPALPRVALAQRVLIAPSATTDLVFDDNLFGTPEQEAMSDAILRVTPGLSVSRETATTYLFGDYNVDAERHREHPTLTTALSSGEHPMTVHLRTIALVAVVASAWSPPAQAQALRSAAPAARAPVQPSSSPAAGSAPSPALRAPIVEADHHRIEEAPTCAASSATSVRRRPWTSSRLR